MSVRFINAVYSDQGIRNHSDLLVMLVLADLCDEQGWCYPGVQFLADRTRHSKQGVINVIERLVAAGKIAKVKGSGGSHDRKNGYQILITTGQRHLPVTGQRGTSGRVNAVKGTGQRHKVTYIRDPLVDPLKRSTGVSGNGNSSKSLAEEIYDLYPKKVARPKAIAAIAKHFKTFDPGMILEATRNFANAWKGATPEEMKYCPHPATWFNGERFKDDPSTWRAASKQRSQPDYSKGF